MCSLLGGTRHHFQCSTFPSFSLMLGIVLYCIYRECRIICDFHSKINITILTCEHNTINCPPSSPRNVLSLLGGVHDTAIGMNDWLPMCE